MRKTSLLITAILLGLSPFVIAQDMPMQPSPVAPGTIIGPELIIWSQEQKPQPIPQPLPQPDSPSQKPSEPAQQQPGDPANSQASQSQAQQPAPTPTSTQSFTGTIAKNGSRYVLKVSETSVYQLDDQEKAKEYEGKQVKVSGSLDQNSNTLHISSIELIS